MIFARGEEDARHTVLARHAAMEDGTMAVCLVVTAKSDGAARDWFNALVKEGYFRVVAPHADTGRWNGISFRRDQSQGGNVFKSNEIVVRCKLGEKSDFIRKGFEAGALVLEKGLIHQLPAPQVKVHRGPGAVLQGVWAYHCISAGTIHADGKGLLNPRRLYYDGPVEELRAILRMLPEGTWGWTCAHPVRGKATSGSFAIGERPPTLAATADSRPRMGVIGHRLPDDIVSEYARFAGRSDRRAGDRLLYQMPVAPKYLIIRNLRGLTMTAAKARVADLMVQAFQIKYGVALSHADFEQRLEKRGPNLHLACTNVGDLWEAREALYDVSQRQGRRWLEHDPLSPTIVTIIPQCVCSHCLHGRCRQCHRPETACSTPGGCRLRPGCRRCFADGFNPDHPEGQCALLRFGYDHVDEGCSICGCVQHQAPRLDGSVQPLDTPVCPCVYGEGNLNLWLPSELVGGPVMTVEDLRALPRSMQAGPNPGSGGGRAALPPRLEEGVMSGAASSGPRSSPGLLPAQATRATEPTGRGPNRGPQAETVLGMVAPAKPQQAEKRQQAAGYGGRYTSHTLGTGSVPPPASAPPETPRPVPRPMGRPAASGFGQAPLPAQAAPQQGGPGAGEHASTEGGEGATGRGAPATMPAAPQPALASQQPLDSAMLVRPIASAPPQGTPPYVFDSTGTAVVRYSQAPMDMVSLGQRMALMEEGLRTTLERQKAWEARKADEAVLEKAAQAAQASALEKRLEEAVQSKLETTLGDITTMLKDLHSDRSRSAEGAGSSSQQTDGGKTL